MEPELLRHPAGRHRLSKWARTSRHMRENHDKKLDAEKKGIASKATSIVTSGDENAKSYTNMPCDYVVKCVQHGAVSSGS